MSVKQKPKLTREWIDPFAISIVERLQRKGYTSYLVGGCVRDLLAGHRPKDYDLVTSAKPEEIRACVDRAFIIGKRFRLVLVKRGLDQFEVATFRSEPSAEDGLNEEGMQIRDNVFGTPEEDARRRDFTVNSMFYDPVKDEIIDYCEGLKDIEDRKIRIIGDPMTRLTEDPIRSLRALRLAHKLDFTIEPNLREAMVEKAPLLMLSALPRRREEMLKILKLDDPTTTLHEAHDLGILQHAFPSLDKLYSNKEAIDDFDTYLGQIHQVSDGSVPEPIHLFGVLILAYVRALLHHDPHEAVTEIHLKHEPLVELMRKELGVFNLEGSTVLRAIEMQHDLLFIDEYLKRGHRRRRGFLRHEALPLALVFAEIDHVLAPKDLHFWKNELKGLTTESDSHPSNRT